VTAATAEMPARTRGYGLEWQDRARCTEADPELFFPAKGLSARSAKRFCRACEVRAECLDYALRNGIMDGIWGGTSERERHVLRRALVPAEPTPADDRGRYEHEDVMPCGTEAAYRRHCRRGEPIDEECRLAGNRARNDRDRRDHRRCPACRSRVSSQRHKSLCGES
jgi:WhiB family redox-sensing transcriptional regulator